MKKEKLRRKKGLTGPALWPFMLLAGFLVLSGPGISRAAEPIGEVVALEGKAKIFSGGGTVEKALTKGAPLFVKDKIKTGKGKAKLLFRDDSLIVLGEETELILTEHEFSEMEGKRSAKFNLTTGKMRALVGRFFRGAGSRFEVETPTSTTGVRGSHFIVEVIGADGQTVVIALSGEITVEGMTAETLGQQILLAAGMMSTVVAGGGPSDPSQASGDQLNNALAGTDFQLPDWLVPVVELLQGSGATVNQPFTLVVTEVPDPGESTGQGDSESWRALVYREESQRNYGDVVIHY